MRRRTQTACLRACTAQWVHRRWVYLLRVAQDILLRHRLSGRPISGGGGITMQASRSWNWSLVFLTVVAAGAQVWGAPLREGLQYERGAIASGEPWRLVTGQLLHLNWSHYGVDTATLWVFWAVLQHHLSRVGVGYVIAVSGMGVGLGLYSLSPEIRWYVGLSGINQGVLVAGALAAWDHQRVLSLILLSYITVKLVAEQTIGPMPGSEWETAGPVVLDAHLYGALSGMGAYVIRTGASRWVSRATSGI